MASKAALSLLTTFTVVAAVAAVAATTTTTHPSRIELGDDPGTEIGADASIEFGEDAGLGVDAPDTPDAVAADARIDVDAPIGIDAPSCPIESLAPEDAGDGEFEYIGELISCASAAPVPARFALMGGGGGGPPKLDNKIKEREKIEKARENDRRHAELLAENRTRIVAVLETPSKMPAAGEKNPLGITFERFKEAVDGDARGERTALQFIDTPAGGGQPARTAKENQAQMAAELKDAMKKVNERLQREGGEALGEYQFVIIGSGTTFYSNNHIKFLNGEPKVFGQKTTGTPPNERNERGERRDVDMDIQLTCPSMVSYVAERPHELNDKITRYLGPDAAIYNLFKSSGTNGVLTKYFPELQQVVTAWTTKLGLKEVDIKLVTELEIKEVGAAPGPILLLGGP